MNLKPLQKYRESIVEQLRALDIVLSLFQKERSTNALRREILTEAKGKKKYKLTLKQRRAISKRMKAMWASKAKTKS